MLDTACIGLVAGQILGRWGNFFNREAFGGYTDGSVCHAASGQCSACHMRSQMQMWAHVQIIGGEQFIQVHPTFLYESFVECGCDLFPVLVSDTEKVPG